LRFFFYSRRRRHTRSKRDWSSDVCSSDLIKPHAPPLVRAPVNSFEFHSCERTPQVGHLILSRNHSGPNRPEQLVTIVYGVDYQRIQSCLLTTLSSISVSKLLAISLRNRCSVLYLYISPLHCTFQPPHSYSRPSVSTAGSRLSREISPLT